MRLAKTLKGHLVTIHQKFGRPPLTRVGVSLDVRASAPGSFLVYLSQQAQGGPGMWMSLGLASVEDLAALYHEYQAQAARIVEPPTDKAWAMREMLVEDVDDHILRIGAPQPHAPH